MDSSFDILKKQIDSYIDKYYLLRIYRGGIVFGIAFFTIIFLVSILEFIGWFSLNIRLFLLIFSTASIGFFLINFLLIPILRFFNILKRISNYFAAKLIAVSFPEFSDKIINVLELSNSDFTDNVLIIKSIEQKSKELNEYDFTKSLKSAYNFKLFKYLVFSSLVFILTLILQPKIFTEGTKRIVNFTTHYQKDIGYSISIDTSKLYVNRNEDLFIDVNVEGDVLIDELFIEYGNRNYILEKSSENNFRYLFKNVNNNFSFRIVSSNYKSNFYKITVIDIPILKNFSAEIIFPEYLDKEKEILKNVTNFSLPVGSFINFQFFTQFSDTLFLSNSDTSFISSSNSNIHNINILAENNLHLNLDISNKFDCVQTNLLLTINVIPDLYPSINVNYVKDENNYRLFYFKGKISDDYGFSNLVVKNDDFDLTEIPFLKNVQNQEFYYSYEFPLKQNKNSLVFIVSDNDEYNGYKSTKSETISIEVPSINDIAKKQSEEYSKINNKLEKGLFMAKELQRDITEIKKSLINDNLQTWEKQNQLKALTQKHKQLENIVKELAQQNKDKNNFQNSFSEQSEELLEKQKQIQEMLDNVITDEIKDLIKELNKLSESFNEQELNELTDKLELNYDELNKELDKNLELLKRFEIEEGIDNKINQLNELSKMQKDLSSDIKNKSHSFDSLSNVNNNHNDILQDIISEYDSLKVKNNELEKPFDLNNFSDDLSEIKDDINNNSENIDSKKGSENAKNTSEKLKKLADRMQEMMNNSKQQNDGEDADLLRQILENLFEFSFNQEFLIQDLLFMSYDNPQFVEIGKKQKKLKDDYNIIRDSLYALSKRNAMVGAHISNTAFTIETELLEIVPLFEKRNLGSIRNRQQDVLTLTNDMILILSESLKNMDSMGSGSGSGKKKKKPKKGEESLGEMKGMQESFKQQLENMLKQMKGDKGKPGSTGKKQLGQMLAQQEIMQQMLNEMLNNGSVGKEATKQLKEIKRLMENNKRDLINMNLSGNTFNRQKQILTRLLEAENAELERDKDNTRESNEANKYNISNPEKLFDGNNENINFNEIFNTKSVNLFDFYKYKYQEYLMKINSNTNEKRN